MVASKNDPVYIVTGAPGAGKTTALGALLRLRTDYIIVDGDWLLGAASDLAKASVRSDRSTWRPYRALWFEVLHAIARNGRTPVLFAAIDEGDVEELGDIAWCGGIAWLLLDCGDSVRRERLRRREGWSEAMIDDALADAAALRVAVQRRVDTGAQLPGQIAQAILSWLHGADVDGHAP